MAFKIVAGIVGVVLMLAFISPVVFKLREPALSVVVVIGVVMMLIDLWQSLTSKNDE